MNKTSCQFGIFYLKLPDHRIALCMILGITAITSTLLNSLILYSIWKTPSLHKPSYILIASLALSDFLNGIAAEPMTVLFNLTILMDWESLFCSIWRGSLATGYWLGFVSGYTVTLMSVDRFLAIKLTNMYRPTVTSRRVASVIILGWIGVATLVSLIAFSTYIPTATGIIIVAVFVFPLLMLITVCSSLAFYYLKKMSSSVSSSSSDTTHEAAAPEHQSFNANKYRRSLNTIVLVIFSRLLFYLPLVGSGIVAEVLLKAGQEIGEDTSSVAVHKLGTTSEAIALMNSIVNPLLYMWRVKDLRRAVGLTLRKIFRRQAPSIQEQHGQA